MLFVSPLSAQFPSYPGSVSFLFSQIKKRGTDVDTGVFIEEKRSMIYRQADELGKVVLIKWNLKKKERKIVRILLGLVIFLLPSI